MVLNGTLRMKERNEKRIAGWPKYIRWPLQGAELLFPYYSMNGFKFYQDDFYTQFGNYAIINAISVHGTFTVANRSGRLKAIIKTLRYTKQG